MSLLNKVAANILLEMSNEPEKRILLSKVAREIQSSSRRNAFVDRDAEWQRVHSYIADALKDMHVLYAKLARLQGDFSGAELENLNEISEKVLGLGEQMSKFSREFSQGDVRMMESPTFDRGSQGGQAPAPPASSDSMGEPPPPPPEESGSEGKVQVTVEGEREGEGGEAGPEEWASEEDTSEEDMPEEPAEEPAKKEEEEEE